MTIDRLDWTAIGRQLDAQGYCLLPGLLSADAARGLAGHIASPDVTRAPLASGDPDGGELFNLGACLPAALDVWRTALYRHLAIIANRWNEALDAHERYPTGLGEFLRRNREAGQMRPQSHLSRLFAGDYMSLHQRNEGEHVFSLQLIALLSEPGRDFVGGEFVMTEQRPRMQSRPLVLPLKLGDAAIIATAERPVKGSKGYYRVNLRHAISRVHEGQRIGLELSFHDAP